VDRKLFHGLYLQRLRGRLRIPDPGFHFDFQALRHPGTCGIRESVTVGFIETETVMPFSTNRLNQLKAATPNGIGFEK
jgi:hypothetical protein